ncbi:MAG: 7-cyano-7-deazaguanine synthase QueC [Armatimonadetes bacterium]|nr:7-cyano-7-deazaguanine synthase QueC [Armatimonadota bacterium]
MAVPANWVPGPGIERAIVLLSGGLDSVVTSAFAAAVARDVLALTFDYGQRAAAREIIAARAVAEALGIQWQKIDLTWLGELGASALTDRCVPIPSSEALAEEERSAAVWVPNRNMVFVAVAGAYADAWSYQAILLGLNKEEAAVFPDNSIQFASACTAALSWSTRVRPVVWGPLAGLDKREIVEFGRQIGAPLELVWSCYGEGPAHCWECDSCRRLRTALEAARAWPEHKPRWGEA